MKEDGERRGVGCEDDEFGGASVEGFGDCGTNGSVIECVRKRESGFRRVRM